ncbi:MAG: NYN domain-containing protein [Candidatus Promineifilaceae bacterium]|nr:NYN domain-containing protein [Candidatus Promineifilaceae bacterium]
MHYLIDGHNLIARMPDINLSDPDDEAQLILRLRSWISGSRKRTVTVYFDGGLPGGRAHDLSGQRLDVIFASQGRPADELLVRRIRRVQNPPEYTLVSADREIVTAAEKRKMPVIPPETFAAGLDESAPQEPDRTPATERPLLSEDEVALWLDIFGPEPELPPSPPGSRSVRRRQEPATGKEETAEPEPPPVRDADALKASGAALTDEEVAVWLELFGSDRAEKDELTQEAPDEQAVEQAGRKGAAEAEKLRQQRREQRRKERLEPRPADRLKASGAPLTSDEVEEWMDIFSDPDERADDA